MEEGEGGRGYVLSLCCAQVLGPVQASKQVQGRVEQTGQGRVERRKEAGSKYMEGSYVRMDGSTQVCMYQCHIL